MAIPKGIEMTNIIGLVILLGIALFSKVAQCAPFGSRRGLVETVFDVTRFGARPNSAADSTRGIMMAWRQACESTGPAKVVIPKGTFNTGELIFQGPCTSTRPLIFEIQGTMLSKTDLSLYTRHAWIMFEDLDGIIITGGGTLNGQGNATWKYAGDGSGPLLPSSLILQSLKNSAMHHINLVDSKGFHMKVTDSSDITLSNLKITAPGDSPNTDGIHISETTNINITDSIIGTGDDCISIGDGNINVFVYKITCGPGHGISIGSLGKRIDEKDVRRVRVKNCTLTGTTNGARIKTYRSSPSLQASDIVYEDIIMNDVRHPIIIDQHYNSKDRAEPSRVKVSDVHFRNIRGTTSTKAPVSLNCSEALPCEGVELLNIDLSPTTGLLGLTALLPAKCQNVKTILRGKQNPPAC